MAKLIIGFALHAEGLIFESQPRHVCLKTGSDSPTAKCFATSEGHGSTEVTIINGCPFHRWCGMLKNPHGSMAVSAVHRSKFKALHRKC